MSLLSATFLNSAIRPFSLNTVVPSSLTTAIPAESYPLYSNFSKPDSNNFWHYQSQYIQQFRTYFFPPLHSHMIILSVI